MKLQNQDKQAELEQLIGNLNVSNQVFYEIQDKALSIKENISRNKKFIEALESDNQEAQKEIDNLQVSDTGEINFDGFDELSERISKNTRKIDTIRKVVEKFEIQLEILLMTEYEQHLKICNESARKCFSLIGDELFNEFISGSIAEELSRILTIFDKGGRYADVLKYSTDSNIRDIFIDELIKLLRPRINAGSNVQDLGVILPEVKLSIPIPSCSLLQRNKHLEELKNKLNQY